MDLKTLLPEYYILNSFKFTDGTILKNQIVEYTTLGTPIFDDENHIVNAIIYFHGTTGSYGSIKRIQRVVGKKLPFDTDKFFFVSCSTLGSPGSSSPSTSGFGDKYPKYSILDMVNFNKEFLEQCFNIVHPLGLIGNSMGGFEAISWACNYPDSIDFLISLVSSYKVGGQNYVISKVMNDIIESDPNFINGDFDADFKRSLMLSSKAMYSFGLSREYYMNLSLDEIDSFMEEFALEDSDENILDAYYRNKASMGHDLTSKLSNIIVPTLIIGIYEDQYFPPELDATSMNALVPSSKLTCYNSYLGHIGSLELDKISTVLEEFLSVYK